MNILLVYPRYPDTFWSFKHVLRFVSKKAAFPPLGLLTVASMLPAEWNKKLVDVNVRRLRDKDIRWADMVFVSAMLIQTDSAREIMRRCRAAGKTVVAGGPGFTTHPESFPEADHFVLNEAEVTLPQFLDDFHRGTLQRVYTSTERPDITHTPPPMWSLVRIRDYATMCVQFSRGCPFNCDFCDIIIMNGRVPRTKTPTQLLSELDGLYDLGWRGSVFIVDDNFIGNKSRVKAMLPHLIRWQEAHRFPFMFLTEASIDLADDEELMTLMSQANFHKVFLGLETPSPSSLRECGKFQNANRDPALSVRRIHEHGMQVMGGFIVGFDSDTEGIFDAQIRFIQQLGIVTAMVGVLNALPQTRLWQRLKEEDRLLKDSTGENTDGSLNFIPKMGVDKLVAGYHRIIATIYSPRNYYQRINVFIKSYRPRVRSRLTRYDIQAFLRSMWRIGIFSRSCLLYWRLIIRTVFTKFRALPIAVELAIFGLHFEKMSRRLVRS